MVLACRSVSRGEQIAASFAAAAAAEGRPPPSLEVAALDLSSLASVRSFATAFVASKRPLQCLVNNAGVFDMGTPRATRNAAGMEQHWATNFVAPALLAMLLLPALRAAPGGGRVVNVSSIMHSVGVLALSDASFATRRYTPTRAYAASKLAALLWTAELGRRVGGSGVRCVSVHPGNVLTGVVRTLPGALQRLYRFCFTRVLLSPEEGARAVVAAAGGSRATLGALGEYADSRCRPAPHLSCGDAGVAAADVWAHAAHAAGLSRDTLRDLGLDTDA